LSSILFFFFRSFSRYRVTVTFSTPPTSLTFSSFQRFFLWQGTQMISHPEGFFFPLLLPSPPPSRIQQGPSFPFPLGVESSLRSVFFFCPAVCLRIRFFPPRLRPISASRTTKFLSNGFVHSCFGSFHDRAYRPRRPPCFLKTCAVEFLELSPSLFPCDFGLLRCFSIRHTLPSLSLSVRL